MLKDADIRDCLCEFLELRYGKVRFFDELTIGRSRADIVMVTEDALYGIEIKSDADTYARLAGQVKDYNRFFDYNIVVAGSSHAHHIREHVPEHWGVITVETVDNTAGYSPSSENPLHDDGTFAEAVSKKNPPGKVSENDLTVMGSKKITSEIVSKKKFSESSKSPVLDFYELRHPGINTKARLTNQLSLLWKREFSAIQAANGLYKYPGKSRAFVKKYLLENVPHDKLKIEMLEQLFERDYTLL